MRRQTVSPADAPDKHPPRLVGSPGRRGPGGGSGGFRQALVYASLPLVLVQSAASAAHAEPSVISRAPTILPELPRSLEVERLDGESRAESAELERMLVSSAYDDDARAVSLADAGFHMFPTVRWALHLARAASALGVACGAVASSLLALELGARDDDAEFARLTLSEQVPACHPRLVWIRLEPDPLHSQVEVGGATLQGARYLALDRGEVLADVSAPSHQSRQVRIVPSEATSGSHELQLPSLSPSYAPSRVRAAVRQRVGGRLGNAERWAWGLTAAGGAAVASGIALLSARVRTVRKANRLSVDGTAPFESEDWDRWLQLNRRASHLKTSGLFLTGFGVAALAGATWAFVRVKKIDAGVSVSAIPARHARFTLILDFQ